MAPIHSQRLCYTSICMVFGVASSFLVLVSSSKVIFKVKCNFQGHNNKKNELYTGHFCVLGSNLAVRAKI